MYRLEATMKASAPAGVMEARRACTTASWSVAPTENRTASVPAVVSFGDEGTQQRDRKPPVKPQKRTEGFQPPPETGTASSSPPCRRGTC